MSLVWFNGQFVRLEDARVSAFDAGLQHAVGLFETMLARNGRVLQADAHLERLKTSATELRLTERLNVDLLQQAIDLTLQKNDLADARIRLTVTGGDLNLLSRGPAASPGRRSGETDTTQNPSQPQSHPTILIHAQPPQRYPDVYFEEGVPVTIANPRLNPLDPFAGHKTLNYWPRLQALQEAALLGASEALWFTVSNHLAGGSVSNVFIVNGGRLLTPIARGEEETVAGADGAKMPSPVLPGVTREWIMQTAKAETIAVQRRMLDINDLLGADEIFLTNSSWGVLPVVGVERKQIGTGRVGEITRRLRNAWLELESSSTR